MKGLRIDTCSYPSAVRISYKDLRLEIPEEEWANICQENSPDGARYIAFKLLHNRNNRPVPGAKRDSKVPPPQIESMQRELDYLLRQKRAHEKQYAQGATDEITGIQLQIRINQVTEQLHRLRDEESWKSVTSGIKKKFNFEDKWDDDKFAKWLDGNKKCPTTDYAGDFDDWADAASYAVPPKAPDYIPKPEDKIMANKFLPFIVEKSTPDHIYRTLLSRSKGMNINLVTSIFWMVADKGVGELREYIKTLPENISVAEMYSDMVQKFAQYQIFDEDLCLFTDLSDHFTADDWQEFDPDLIKELDPKDIMAFICVMYKMNAVENWTEFAFPALIEHKDEVLTNISQFVKFADDGEATEFYGASDLRSFILYQALLKFSGGSPTEHPIKVLFVERPQNDIPF